MGVNKYWLTAMAEFNRDYRGTPGDRGRLNWYLLAVLLIVAALILWVWFWPDPLEQVRFLGKGTSIRG